MVRRIHRLGLLPEFGIAGYKDTRHKNDKLSAHELLQNAWLRQNNKVPSRNSGIAKGNPDMALHEQDVHKHISRLQRNANLFDPKKLKAQSAMDNIELNTNLTRHGIYIGLLRRGWKKSSTRAYATKLASNLRASAINFARKNNL